MTREQAIEEAVKELDSLIEGGDEECQHCLADEYLCSALGNLGAPEIADAFRRAKGRCGFWYA